MQILSLLRDAMGPDSAILIDEMVFPEQGTSWRSAYIDIIMMTGLAGREHTRAQWTAIVENAGLKIKKAVPYIEQRHDAILVVTLA